MPYSFTHRFTPFTYNINYTVKPLKFCLKCIKSLKICNFKDNKTSKYSTQVNFNNSFTLCTVDFYWFFHTKRYVIKKDDFLKEIIFF